MLPTSFVVLAGATVIHAFFLMGANNVLTTQRLDPVVSPGRVSAHAHTIVGGSNFGPTVNTASLRASQCTSVPIPQDKSIYWAPTLYFHANDGSFTSVTGNMVIYYLYNDEPNTMKEFPDDFRMISGDTTLRTYNPNSFAQQAITFLCLDFSGRPVGPFPFLPRQACPNGIRSQINFPSCWDGRNVDSPDHKSHVAFRSEGPDRGTCTDPRFPVDIPRIFMEIYWNTNDLEARRHQAMDSNQPFVFANGDTTGYGNHGDFVNGWDAGVLQRVMDRCSCTTAAFGDLQCCTAQGYLGKKEDKCRITNTVDEVVLGTLPKLPGHNPVPPDASTSTDAPPPFLSPVYVYTGETPPTSSVVTVAASSATPQPTSASHPPPHPTASFPMCRTSNKKRWSRHYRRIRSEPILARAWCGQRTG